MRILFIGDVVGRSGRAIVLERLPGLIAEWKLDLVVTEGLIGASLWVLVVSGVTKEFNFNPLSGSAGRSARTRIRVRFVSS